MGKRKKKKWIKVREPGKLTAKCKRMGMTDRKGRVTNKCLSALKKRARKMPKGSSRRTELMREITFAQRAERAKPKGWSAPVKSKRKKKKRRH
jgi:hypothetical protein